jgi:hypothetical protein
MLSRAKSLGICSSFQNLWSCFFSGYGKRDDGLQRQASKNSYVGKQHHTIKASKQTKKTTAKALAKSEIIEAPAGNTVPVCPPVFEGDFWVTECVRVYRLVHTRTQGVRYDKDKTLNQRKCRETLKTLMTKPIAYAFNHPVDAVLLNIPDYTIIIKKPMDFGTVRDKLRSNSYRSMLEFAQDMRLTCTNAMTYNPPAHVIHTLAKQLLDEFEQIMVDMVTERVGEIFASSSDVDTWLSTYPVNSAMEKEEKKKRQREQLQQKLLIASGQQAGTSAGSGPPPDTLDPCRSGNGLETAANTQHVSGVESTEITTEMEVADMMDINESDEHKLSSLLMDAHSARSAVPEEPLPGSTLCDTRRVFFSSPTKNVTDTSISPFKDDDEMDTDGHPDDQQQGLDSDEYGFVDIESETGQSDYESRTGGMSDGNESDDEKESAAGNERSDATNESVPENENIDTIASSYNTLASLPEETRPVEGGASESSPGLFGGGDIQRLSRHDSIESVMSVAEPWPRRPDRTSSMCVEESMETFSSSVAVASASSSAHSRPLTDRLSIDIAATRLVPTKAGASSTARKNSLNMNIPFDKPQLGIKGAQALMSELSKNVNRLKDDMYVLMFAPPPGTAQELDLPSSSSSSSNAKKSLGEEPHGISQECLLMLQDIVPDTSDPDPSIRSPFIESRQTFLEMCQFRHLQFDCLRRAKYSSSLLIFHLLFPDNKNTRPHCNECNQQIKNVRWHCDSCHVFPDYELCNACKYSIHRKPHEHEDSLTPVRVSYL